MHRQVSNDIRKQVHSDITACLAKYFHTQQWNYYRTQWTAERCLFWHCHSSLWFFVCVWNISGTAERICAKFTWKTSLVPRSDEFKGQGQMSRSLGTKQRHFPALSAACVRFMFGKASLASSSYYCYVQWILFCWPFFFCMAWDLGLGSVEVRYPGSINCLNSLVLRHRRTAPLL